jgi:tetratricopeptide (TPR) repeat protein
MPRGRRSLVTLGVVLGFLVGPARVDGQALAETRPGAGGVLDVAIGERAAARRIHIEARSRLLSAIDPERDVSLGPAADTLIEQAIARYDVVLSVFPEDVDAWLERGLALSRFRRTLPDGRVERRIDEAMACLRAARAIDPAREAGWVAFELAVLRTEQHDYRGAAEEYARALAEDLPYATALQHAVSHLEELAVYLFAAPGPPTILGNWAEVTMLDGDPVGAIELYVRARDAAAPGTAAATLALWGLALAEERAGNHADALSDAARAIGAEPPAHHTTADAALASQHGVFAALHQPGVFFEPACEIHAYEALGHEALAATAATREARASELGAALRSTRYFLAEGGRSTVYASVAERAEARLSAALAQPSERSRP